MLNSFKLLLIVVFLSAGLINCSGSQYGSCDNGVGPSGPLPSGAGWSGIWFTNFGQMSITVEGRNLVGEFCDDDRQQWGRIEGTIQGNIVHFRWVSHDVRMVGRDRVTEGSGVIQHQMEKRGDLEVEKFIGSWGYGNEVCGGGPWRGEKSARFSQMYAQGRYEVQCDIKQGNANENVMEENGESESTESSSQQGSSGSGLDIGDL